MSELLSAAASALGVPEPLVQRAAAARAAETGKSVDEILTAWAGGKEVAASAPTQEPEPAAEPETPTEEAAEPAEPEVVPEPVVATPEEPAETPTAPAPAAARAAPSEVTPREALRYAEVVTVPTAGIRERPNYAIPRWLTYLIVIAPMFALFALGSAATGECGAATELRTDVVTGEIVNCDGSEFTGRPVGGGGANLIALGEDIYAGSAVTGVNCATCHGAGGQGTATFPALTGVLTTFGACADHAEWVTLGSAGFTAGGRSTYGDTNKTVNGGMPTFGNQLTEEQLAAVVAFERVRFGGANPEETLVECGLVEPPEEGTEGEGTDTTVGEGEETGTTIAEGENGTTTAPEAVTGRSG